MQIAGYSFRDPSLCDQALSHKSLEVNNQRLETFGDAIIRMIVVEYLFHNYPSLDEGQLTQLTVQIIRGSCLASLARSLEIQDKIRFASPNIQPTEAILEDTFEALVAAIYLDGGYEQSKTWLVNLLHQVLPQDLQELLIKSPKNSLQELCISAYKAYPSYALLETKHKAPNEVFIASVSSPDGALHAIARGAKKIEAEEQAATLLLEQLETFP